MEENNLPSNLGQAPPSPNPVETVHQPLTPPQFQPTYAGFWVRLAATYVDGIVFSVPLVAIGVVIGLVFSSAGDVLSTFDNFQNNPFVNISFSLIYLSIILYFVTKYGGTPGKILYGLRIVKSDGKYPDLKTAILREVLGRILCVLTLNLGYLWVAFDKEKQGLNDHIARTHVILTKPVSTLKRLLIIFLALLLPIAILGIMAAAVLVAINPAKRTRQAQDSSIKNDVGNISGELQYYYSNYSMYPATLMELESSGGARPLPKTTPSGFSYVYTVSPDRLNAAVYANLEQGNLGSDSVWCWSSSALQAKEVLSAAECLP